MIVPKGKMFSTCLGIQLIQMGRFIMRDFVYKESVFRARAYAWTRLRMVTRNWLRRRSLRQLEALSDHELKDIGLTRDDLYHVMKLPLSVDPIWEMDRLRMHSARRGGDKKS
jgi:uncharacterized protein YjiS (DUF1127 family)